MADAQHTTGGTGKITAGTGDVTANTQGLHGTGQVVMDLPGHHGQTGVPTGEAIRNAIGSLVGGTGTVTCDIPGHNTSKNAAPAVKEPAETPQHQA